MGRQGASRQGQAGRCGQVTPSAAAQSANGHRDKPLHLLKRLTGLVTSLRRTCCKPLKTHPAYFYNLSSVCPAAQDHLRKQLCLYNTELVNQREPTPCISQGPVQATESLRAQGQCPQGHQYACRSGLGCLPGDVALKKMKSFLLPPSWENGGL